MGAQQQSEKPFVSNSWTKPDQIETNHVKQYLEQVTRESSVYKWRTIELLRLAPGQKVLDVGCGLGTDAENMARVVGPRGSVIGVDTNPELIREAQGRVNKAIPWLEFRVADGNALPFGEGSFDACRTDRVLQHLTNPEGAVAEMVRVTRPNGRICISEPDWYTAIMAGGDVRVAQSVSAHQASRSVRHGDMGRRVPGLLAASGCTDLETETTTYKTVNLETANYMLGIRSALTEAVNAGSISRDDASTWWVELEMLNHRGGFFACMSGIITSATVARAKMG